MSVLHKKLQQEPFSPREAKKLGVDRNQLAKLLRDGVVVRVAYGIYLSSNIIDLSEEDQMKSALLRTGEPSAICLQSALSYYNLTDIIPKKIWILVLATKVSHQKDLRLWRRRKPKWDIGIDKKGKLRITSIERTIVECLRYKELVGGPGEAVSALKRALSERKTTPTKLLKIASKLEIKERVLPYLESLL
jgi:predicted transcriptional regulator of viral defense system